MQFEKTSVAGAYVIRPQLREDHRGHFARLWCGHELAERGLVSHIAQVNTGFSPRAGTLRGLHWQMPPHAEVKIARCTRGAVFDVAVDLRPSSPTYRCWSGMTLTPENGLMLYVPEGCAHGYLTLEADSELVYFTSHPYVATSARGARFDDAAFKINWPAEVQIISAADTAWPPFMETPDSDAGGAAV